MKIPSLKNLSSTRYLAHRALSRFMMKTLEGKKFDVVLDVGSGRGPYKKFISCKKYIALDVENRTGDPHTVIADLNESIPLGDAYADCVILTEVLEHLKKPGHALKEINRVLKPSGIIILTTPMTWPLHEVPNDFFRYTKFGLEYLLGESGFNTIMVKPSNAYSVTLLQMLTVTMKNRALAPFVILINLIAIALDKIDKNYDWPIVNLVVARK